MKTTDNTLLITGGGSGIGHALAESFQALGNQVIISGRTQKSLDETTAANPGMKCLTVDMTDPKSIKSFAVRLTEPFTTLNAVIHNAGVMRPENLLEQPDDLTDAEAIIATNLLGPIRLTAALLPTLKNQPHATVMTVSSGLAFVPMGEFIKEVMEILQTQPEATEIKVRRVYPLRFAAEGGQEKYEQFFTSFNDAMKGH